MNNLDYLIADVIVAGFDGKISWLQSEPISPRLVVRSHFSLPFTIFYLYLLNKEN